MRFLSFLTELLALFVQPLLADDEQSYVRR